MYDVKGIETKRRIDMKQSSTDLARNTILALFKRRDSKATHFMDAGTLMGLTNSLENSHVNEAVEQITNEGIVTQRFVSNKFQGIVLTEKGEDYLYN